MAIIQLNTLYSYDFLQNLYDEHANDLDDFLNVTFNTNHQRIELQEHSKHLSVAPSLSQYSEKTDSSLQKSILTTTPLDYSVEN